jgi:uncharacterized protein YlxW (UPF0749 family)
MENLSAESTATTAMLKQLCDTLSTMQQQIADLSTQVTTTNTVLRENRERIDVLEARTEEIVQRSPPSSGTAPAVPPGVVYTATPPPAPMPNDSRLKEHPVGPDGHHDAQLHQGNALGILGNPPPSPSTGIPTVPNSSDPCLGT